MQEKSDTICAPITPMQAAAVGVIRISGPDAFAAARALFSKPERIRHGQAVYGELRGADGGVLDTCVLTAFAAPRSYTGEDVVELSCHGSPTVLRLALRALGGLGVRMAQPGEFTRRAFVNGKLDLTQAEAVMELIEADSRREAAAAGAHLQGSTARKIEALRDRLLTIAAAISAYVDFPDDEIEQTGAAELEAQLRGIEEQARELLRGYDAGRIVRDGVRTVIAGRTNAGKSSLMNLLAGGEYSIVTGAPGTTRDIVERQVSAGGVKLILQDTAGLRRAGAPQRMCQQQQRPKQQAHQLRNGRGSLRYYQRQAKRRHCQRGRKQSRTLPQQSRAQQPRQNRRISTKKYCQGTVFQRHWHIGKPHGDRRKICMVRLCDILCSQNRTAQGVFPCGRQERRSQQQRRKAQQARRTQRQR